MKKAKLRSWDLSATIHSKKWKKKNVCAKKNIAAKKAGWLFTNNEAKEEKTGCNVEEEEEQEVEEVQEEKQQHKEQEENDEKDKTDNLSDAGLDEMQLVQNISD